MNGWVAKKVMEVDGSDDFPLKNWVMFRFQPLIFRGCKLT